MRNINLYFKILLSFVFIFCAIYYFFSKSSTEILNRDLMNINYGYVFLSMIFGSLAYVVRGLRWPLLINPLGYSVSKSNAISAVSVGYFTNLFLPRAGEISRCAYLYKQDKTPIDKLFGTIVIERIIDFMILILCGLIVFIFKFQDLHEAKQLYEENITNVTNVGCDNFNMSFLDIYSSFSYFDRSISFIALMLVIYLLVIKIIQIDLINKIRYFSIKTFINGIILGFLSVIRIKKKIIFLGYTLLIWILYFLMTYVCFYCINDPTLNNLSVLDGMLILFIGGIGMMVPVPGGIGSYHILTMFGLALLLGVPSWDREWCLWIYDEYNPAMLFPIVIWFAQSFVAIIMGFTGSVRLFLNLKVIR